MLQFLAAMAALITLPLSTPSTGTPLLTNIHLHDSDTSMQSFAQDPDDGSWVFVQQTQDGRFGQSLAYHRAHGDLTLTHVSATGQVLGYMYARNFDHGAAMGLQPTSGGQMLIWLGAKAQLDPNNSNGDAFGTQIGRFTWSNGATVWPSSSGTRLWDPFPNAQHLNPSLYWTGRELAVRYQDADGNHYATFNMWNFRDGNFTPQLTIDSIPAPGTPQGWALMPDAASIALLTGDPTTSGNPSPGDTLLTVFGSAGVISQQSLQEIPDAIWREPEGVQPYGAQVCNGWTTGPSGSRVANIYCRLPV